MEFIGKYNLYPDPDFDRIGVESMRSGGSIAHWEHPREENPGKMAGALGELSREWFGWVDILCQG